MINETDMVPVLWEFIIQQGTQIINKDSNVNFDKNNWGNIKDVMKDKRKRFPAHAF